MIMMIENFIVVEVGQAKPVDVFSRVESLDDTVF